jgi:hypothetical protein
MLGVATGDSELHGAVILRDGDAVLIAEFRPGQAAYGGQWVAYNVRTGGDVGLEELAMAWASGR